MKKSSIGGMLPQLQLLQGNHVLTALPDCDVGLLIIAVVGSAYPGQWTQRLCTHAAHSHASDLEVTRWVCY